MPDGISSVAAQLAGDQTTPFFLYDANVLRGNLALLKERWRSPLYVSVKANPNPALLRIAADFCDGFDLSSEREARLVLGFVPDLSRCTVSGPGKRDAFLRFEPLRQAHGLHLDSREEVALALPWGHRRTLRLAIGASNRPKLGFTAEEAAEILGRPESGMFMGFHAYLGRDSFSAERAAEYFSLGEQLAAAHPDRFVADWGFYLGPGLSAAEAGVSAVLPSRSLSLEVGRAALASAGVYAAQVLSVKFGRERSAVIVDGGLQHFTGGLSPRNGYRGCTVRACRAGRIVTGAARAAVYGSLCLGNDILHPDTALPDDLQRGDWLLFEGAGAYGITASAGDFIGQPRPAEWLLDESLRCISPRDGRGYHEAF